jgi:hypothetical protein
LGNVAGQKIQTETGLRTNIYSIALGYSGAGKNAPFSCLPQLLARTGASMTLGPTELTSSTAILRISTGGPFLWNQLLAVAPRQSSYCLPAKMRIKSVKCSNQ